MKRAAIYCRISNDPENDRLGVKRQETDCRRLVKEKGWKLVGVYTDNSVSAYRKGVRRPEYLRLLEDVKQSEVDVIVCQHPDRLHRSPRELEDFIDLLDATGATVATVTAGDYDLATADGRLVARIVGSVARKESEDKSRRLRRKHLELAEEGRISGGGIRPYGYEPDKTTIRESEAETIRNAAQLVLAGSSLRSVCRALNTFGIPTASGKVWVSQTLRGILMSARIAGQREHYGKLTKAAWPAIISAAESAQLRALLGDPARVRARPARRYLLSGLLRCGLCGATLMSRPKAGGKRGYTCSSNNFKGCGRLYIQAEPIEAVIAEAVLVRLDSSAMRRAIEGVSPGTAPSTLDEDQAQLEELARAYGERRIGIAEWLAARKPIEARIANAEETTRLATRSAAVERLRAASDVRAAWAAMGEDIGQQRAVVTSMIDHIVVQPATVHGRHLVDLSRIGEPVWRF